MHELSLAQNLIGQLKDLIHTHKTEKILRVTVEIGPFAGVVIDSFEFGFSALAAETHFCRDAHLEIIQPNPEYRCLECGGQFELRQKERDKGCPYCQSKNVFPKGGNDLVLSQVEME